ncbi:MAG TPA: aspartate-semialdehyde dehydrogenase, partial [Chitinophagaceae bacterium]|nr:aspartate-semialdehyde dehydrogenase [Chitinophagaceae bacterium]
MKVAVVGATGLVGTKMLEVLAERNFPVSELIPVASERSAGKYIQFKGKEIEVLTYQDALKKNPDVALFSAGGSTSLELAPLFAAQGCIVIDNSSAWRMNEQIKLVVPEVNGHVLEASDRIIANPNCSTIQMVLVLKPLHEKYGLKRVVVSTYQSVTGTGVKAVKQLMNERAGMEGEKAYPYPIDLNIIPQIDMFMENDYTKEEMKMLNETRKILQTPSIGLTATCVRMPVMGGHSESVNIELENEFDLQEVKSILKEAPGVKLKDDPATLQYPM